MMPNVEGPMDPIDPPPSMKRRPSWLRDTLEDAERHMAPMGTFCESKKPSRYQGYLAAMGTIIQSELGSFEEAIKHQVWMSGMWSRDQRTKLLSPRNGSIRSSMDLMVLLKSTRQDSLPEASLKKKA